MILSCNSCEKKFVVPDKAITSAGRVVQCGSCGNKWKQFPINEIKKNQSVSRIKKIVSKPQITQQKTYKPKKNKKNIIKKSRKVSLYSPEYLAKKHGIKLNDSDEIISKDKDKITFGFYRSLLLFLVIMIVLTRGLFFSQDFIVQKLPFSKFYIDYFFESIRNMVDIFKNLISNY